MRGRELAVAAGSCALLAAALTAVAFHGLGSDRIPIALDADWDQYATFFEIQRRSLVDHGELPWWNPWLLGGIPGVAHPQFTILSPFFLPVLLFGTAVGTLLFFALHVFVGCAGMWVLARRLGRGLPAAAVAATVFALVFVPFVNAGVANRMNGSLVPWLVVGFVEARRGARGVALTALVTALLLLEGGIYALVGGGIFVLILALGDGGWREIAHAALRFAAGVLLGVAFAGLRVVPMVELYAQFPRESGIFGGAPLFDASRIATLAGAVAALLAAHRVGQRVRLFGQDLFLGTRLSLPLLSLFVLGLWSARRRPLLLVALFVPLLLTLGGASPLNLWAALTRLPGLDSLHLPMSILFVPYVAVALLVADGATRLAQWTGLAPRLQQGLVVAAAGAGLFALQQQAHEIAANWKSEQVAALPPAPPAFTQVPGDARAMLPSVRRNVGVVDGYEMVLKGKLTVAAKGEGQAGYRGEWILASSGAPLPPTHWSPNRLEFAWDGRAADRIVVNQNALPGWSAEFDGREVAVEPRAGLLSAELPAKPGTLVLRYAPRSRAAGAIVSCAGLLLLLLLATRTARALLLRPDGGRIEERLSPP
jgi:hypothetical protein